MVVGVRLVHTLSLSISPKIPHGAWGEGGGLFLDMSVFDGIEHGSAYQQIDFPSSRRFNTFVPDQH